MTSATRPRNWLARAGLVVATGVLVAFAAAGCGDEAATPTATSTPPPTTSTAAPTTTSAPGTPNQTATQATSTPTQATTPTETPSDIDYSQLSGEIRIDGSSTVFPISEAVAEEFSKLAETRVNVAFSGTGGGFEKFCRGETEISDASRPIKQAEIDACTANDINDIVELHIATDALTVVVNPQNTWIDCLTVEELHDLFKEGGAKNWSDIRPDWPAEPIVFYYPGTDSGTFDYMVEAIIDGVKSDEKATHRGDGTASEDDNVLALGVENDKDAIGYFGFAYYEEAGQSLKAVSIDNGEGCVEPTFDNALAGTYAPLSRPLFIYTREQLLKERPEVLGFVKFYLDSAEELVKDVGYITLPEDVLQEQQAKLAPFLPS